MLLYLWLTKLSIKFHLQIFPIHTFTFIYKDRNAFWQHFLLKTPAKDIAWKIKNCEQKVRTVGVRQPQRVKGLWTSYEVNKSNIDKKCTFMRRAQQKFLQLCTKMPQSFFCTSVTCQTLQTNWHVASLHERCRSHASIILKWMTEYVFKFQKHIKT